MIGELVANYPAGLRHDSRFGWSLHNYSDVEQIGKLIGAADPRGSGRY
ncbi:MAG: hypothetical protein M3Y17_00460 [Actinomycetota bacterium]|nr:hypothetical protein [Actinomycetota bacterium]